MSGKIKRTKEELSVQHKVARIVYWFTTAFCLYFFIVSSGLSYTLVFRSMSIAIPLVLGLITYNKHFSVRTQGICTAMSLMIFATVYGAQFRMLGSLHGTFLTIICLTALYHETVITYLEIAYITLMYGCVLLSSSGLIGIPDVSEMEFFIRTVVLYSGMTVIVVLIKWNNRQMLSEAQRTQNVRYLLEVVEIKKNEAEAAAKAKADFLANMSHEIRTPLNAICGMSDLLSRSELTPQNEEYVNTIRSSARSLLEIINDILDFSKIDAGKIELVCEDYSLASVVTEVQEMISARLAGKNVVLIVDVNPDLPSVLNGDCLKIKQILINLLGNAVKFTESGMIKLSVTGEKQQDGSFILSFIVSDTGIGIKKNDLEKLFSEFTQVDTKKNRTIEGTGLGLAISKRLALKMNGDITVSSRYGVGTTFTTSIRQKIIDSSPCVAADKLEKGYFYVIERNPFYRDGMVKIFDKLSIGYEFIDGMEGFTPVEGRKSFLIFDCRCSYGDVKAHRSKLKNTEVIAMADINDGAEVDGSFAFIRKPVNIFDVAQIACGGFSSTKKKQPRKSVNRFYCPDANILVVDDNNINLKVADGLIGAYGAAVTTVSSGFDALEKIKAGNVYDIIFMDHMMPVMDGVETTELIRKLGTDYAREVPIVALTANAVNGVENIFLKAGMNDFLAKPMDIALLSEVMTRWIPTEKQLPLPEPKDERDKNAAAEEINIDGIDSDIAMKMFEGSSKSMLDVLNVIYSDGAETIERMRRLLREHNYKDYTIEVHAIKGICAGIGASALSSHAKEHETAGKSGNYAFIDSDAEQLFDEYTKLLENVRPYTAVNTDIVRNEKAPKMSDSDFSAALGRIIGLIEDFEAEKALGLIDELMETGVSQEGFDTLDKISRLIKDYMYEAATDELEKLIARLNDAEGTDS